MPLDVSNNERKQVSKVSADFSRIFSRNDFEVESTRMHKKTSFVPSRCSRRPSYGLREELIYQILPKLFYLIWKDVKKKGKDFKIIIINPLELIRRQKVDKLVE